MSSIILVEDEHDLRELMVDVLEIAGYEVRSFERADSAWNYIREFGFDANLLITDLKVPGKLDGLQLVHNLHRLLPQMPAVVTSGCHGELTGSYDHVFWLPKPYSVDRLEAICHELTADR